MKVKELMKLLEKLCEKGFGEEDISIDSYEDDWTITDVGYFPGSGVIILSETNC